MYTKLVQLMYTVSEWIVGITMIFMWTLTIYALVALWYPRKAYARTITRMVTTVCLVVYIIVIPILLVITHIAP